MQVSRLSVFFESIKFSHSVFALPFALVAMLVAAGGVPSFWILFWIVIAAVAARTSAMAFNRLADAKYDAENPRTANRALVTGAIDQQSMVLAMVISALVFFFSAAMLNRTCLVLAPPTLAILLGYSLTKRFTNFSHYFLGLALGLAPLGAWIAVTESLAWTPVILSLAVMTWVGGFDILYSCQDYEFDREEDDLHSMPKRLGVAGAMAFARKSHGVSLALFFLFWWVAGLGFFSFLGVLAIGVLLVYQHGLLTPRDLSRIDAAFFFANGTISIAFFVSIFLDIVVF